MGVLKSTRTSLLLKDSLRKSELVLKRLTSVPRGFSQKEEVDLVFILQFLEVLRSMGEIPMIGDWRWPCLG